MISRLPTAHIPVAHLFCDRFHKEISYTNWRPKGSEDWLLIFTESGAGRFTTRLGNIEAQKGDVVLYAPGDLQDYRTSSLAGHWDLLWVHFRPRPHWEAWLKWPHHEIGLKYLRFGEDETLSMFRAALARMMEFSRRSLPGALDLAATALEEALLWAGITAMHTQQNVSDARVRAAADYLSAHLSEPFHLKNLAARCGLSVSRLAHLFKEHTGETPQQFLERRRIQHACHLLRLTELSIAEIAFEVGYADPFYFSNRFRRNIGQSPLRFRRARWQSREGAAQ